MREKPTLLQKAILADRSMGNSPAYTQFKKACSPMVIIDLLKRLKAAEQKLKDIASEIECVPHDVDCGIHVGVRCQCYMADLQAILEDK